MFLLGTTLRNVYYTYLLQQNEFTIKQKSLTSRNYINSNRINYIKEIIKILIDGTAQKNSRKTPRVRF